MCVRGPGGTRQASQGRLIERACIQLRINIFQGERCVAPPGYWQRAAKCYTGHLIISCAVFPILESAFLRRRMDHGFAINMQSTDN